MCLEVLLTIVVLLCRNKNACRELADKLLLYSLHDIEHEYESRKYDCLMHMGMVVLKALVY